MTIHFAICADHHIEVGLHVTLYSAVKSLDKDTKAVAHLFLKEYTDDKLQALNSTLEEFGDRCQLKVYDVENINIGIGKGLHGNKMPYLLLQIPNLVDVDKIICLDADLLIITDLTILFNWDLKGKTVGVANGVKLQNAWSKERVFLNGIGISDEIIYFNTGVLLINILKWRELHFTEKCLEFAAKYPNQLHTADQTVLNAILSKNDSVAFLPSNYNIPCYPEIKGQNLDEINGIYHFVGSPKPWDFMGEMLHGNYKTFQQFLEQTHFKNYKSYKNLSKFRLKRTLMIGRTYYRVIKSRVSNLRKIS